MNKITNFFIYVISLQFIFIISLNSMENFNNKEDDFPALKVKKPKKKIKKSVKSIKNKIIKEYQLPYSKLPNNVRFNIISMLPKEDKCQWRLVSKKYKEFIDLSFFGNLCNSNSTIIPYSSESDGLVGKNIWNILKKAKKRIVIASDKCTNEEFLDDLINLNLTIEIVTGEDKQTKTTMEKEKFSDISWNCIPKTQFGGKMHNKFIIVDDECVITGSPNFTYAAYNYNIESFVVIYHNFIPKLYYRYYQYIIKQKDNIYDCNTNEYKRVKKMLDIFNKSKNIFKVCLSPIMNIKDFFINEINDSENIDINMFLISHSKNEIEKDIINNLSRVAKIGTKVSIAVDKNQFDMNQYMKDAIESLYVLGQKAYVVSKKQQMWETKSKSILTQPQFHDKLVLIKQKGNIKKIFIGSAGFTDNVQDNLNLENMILISEEKIYQKLFDQHFLCIINQKSGLIVEECKY